MNRHEPVDALLRRQGALDTLPLWQAADEPAPCTPLAAPLQSRPTEERDLDDLRRLAAILEQHRGADHAITDAELALLAGLAEGGGSNGAGARRVRDLVARYASSLPWPVAAGGRGRYIPATNDEAAAYAANLLSRLRALTHHLGDYLTQCRASDLDLPISDPQMARILAHLGSLHPRP